jgi:Xaa-Pro dipeptidase
LVLFLQPSSDPQGLVVENLISTLLIPKEDPLETLWSLPPPTLSEAESAYPGHSSIQYTFMLPEILSTLLKTYPDTLVHTLPSDIPSPFPPLPPFFSDSPKALTTPKYLLPALHTARLIKTQHEIGLIRKANAISSRAHELIIRLLGKYATADLVTPLQSGKLVMPEEWRIEKEAEAEAAFVASCRREGFVNASLSWAVSSLNIRF